MTKIKICGLMTPQDAAFVNAVQPDFAGMILSPGFRRTVTRETAAAIRKALNAAIPAVGVFVDAEPADIAAYVNSGIIQTVQLHGHEDAAYIEKLRQITDAQIFQAFRIRSAADVQQAEQSPADMILLDSGTGTGKVFDWSLLSDIRRPYLLAGGLNPENAPAAVAALHPAGVDVSSGVETDGRKDFAKIQAFVNAVRGT
ncbi:MAG: phosphoribosylanthranilate isomerase [Oscillospiraceae bacterium]|nr:phosphoribosylanthranilate isomerase [Oscillospiraceae bacterium]